jgi:hypothetical protein
MWRRVDMVVLAKFSCDHGCLKLSRSIIDGGHCAFSLPMWQMATLFTRRCHTSFLTFGLILHRFIERSRASLVSQKIADDRAIAKSAPPSQTNPPCLPGYPTTKFGDHLATESGRATLEHGYGAARERLCGGRIGCPLAYARGTVPICAARFRTFTSMGPPAPDQ